MIKDAPDFFRMLDGIADRPESFYEFFTRYGVNRSDPYFWEMSDFFIDRFSKDFPETAGIFDLNRYVNEVRPPSLWQTMMFYIKD